MSASAWSRVKNWFVAPFNPRVEQRVTGLSPRVREKSTCVEVPASTQASAFLEWLREDPRRTGDQPPRYLMVCYRVFCDRMNWRVLTWQRVGHELALIIGEGSKVVSCDGRKQRMWHIPRHAPPRVTTAAAASHQRVLGHMATRAEAA